MDVAQVIAELRETAAAAGDLLRLDPGITDEAMDAWPVPVPETVRALLRAIGGIRITTYYTERPGGRLDEHISFGDQLNQPGDRSMTWYAEHAGGEGTHWFVHAGTEGSFTYVDVDPGSGDWGPVFVFWDAADTVRAADSLPDLLLRIAADVRGALAEANGDPHVFVEAFDERAGARYTDAVDRSAVRASEARTGPDPALAAAAADLPDEALVADLGAAGQAVRVDFFPLVTFGYRRAAGGRVLAAVPWDADTVRRLQGA
ncbi:SMI1/KNR4 family protein [Nocardia terpenica]|uniref:SMI1/KNR4 family protein n=1 Tax=Nocardia terpenica TaxID=455432 RepID=A0A6G9Z1J9_9NOCA|nr:SMI1/KNR4 family protein [Nocardia terpenica]QIS19261.1 hypothetical protein F6W96_14165 [Nocardia terpenica]